MPLKPLLPLQQFSILITYIINEWLVANEVDIKEYFVGEREREKK